MNIFRDIEFVFRLFVKYPGSSLLGIIVLGLGLGVSITMFALVNGILWSSPPFDDGDEYCGHRRRSTTVIGWFV